jgi:uncharacterized protein YbjT (DUF2867 family)
MTTTITSQEELRARAARRGLELVGPLRYTDPNRFALIRTNGCGSPYTLLPGLRAVQAVLDGEPWALDAFTPDVFREEAA